MAADLPAKAPPLYEAEPMKSTAVGSVGRPVFPFFPTAVLQGYPMRSTIILLSVALASCHSAQTREQINEMAANGEVATDAPAPATAAPAAKAVSIDRKDALVEFHAGWPAAAAAIPALDARFRSEADKALADLIAGARSDKAMRDKDGIEFHGYTSTVDYRLAGASERLLSLDGVAEGYTGGAHGSHGSIAVLWDKAAGQEIGFAGLFANPAVAYASISKAWCAGLDKERKKRRPADMDSGPDSLFDNCPKLDEIHVIPVDKDGDRRFEALRVIADPYVAGPWAEGDYEVTIPVTTTMVAAFKPDYRASFVG